MPALARIIRPFLPTTPLTRRDRWVVALVWATGLGMGWSQGQASALLPFTRATFGLSEGEMSLLLASARLAAFGALLFGAVADRIGRRRPLLVALALLVAATGVSAAAGSPLAYALAQGAARVGAAAVAALAVVLLAEAVSPAIRAYGISFFGAAASLGSGISLVTLPLAGGAPEAWRTAHALPVLTLLLIPLLWRWIPEPEVFTRRHARLAWRSLLAGESGRRFRLVATAGLLASAFSSVGLAFTTERLIADLGLSPTTAVILALGAGTLGGAGFFVGGHLADRWGRRPTAVLALGLGLTGGVTLFWSTALPVVAGAIFMSTLGSFAFIPAAGAHRAELFPTGGRAAANTAGGYLATVGSSLGLLIGTVTIDRIGLPATMTLLGVGVVVAGLLTLALPETLGQDLAVDSAAG